MGKEGNLNDFLLILQMKQGNEKAFDKFVKTVGDSLYKAGSFFMGE